MEHFDHKTAVTSPLSVKLTQVCKDKKCWRRKSLQVYIVTKQSIQSVN